MSVQIPMTSLMQQAESTHRPLADAALDAVENVAYRDALIHAVEEVVLAGNANPLLVPVRSHDSDPKNVLPLVAYLSPHPDIFKAVISAVPRHRCLEAQMDLTWLASDPGLSAEVGRTL